MENIINESPDFTQNHNNDDVQNHNNHLDF